MSISQNGIVATLVRTHYYKTCVTQPSPFVRGSTSDGMYLFTGRSLQGDSSFLFSCFDELPNPARAPVGLSSRHTGVVFRPPRSPYWRHFSQVLRRFDCTAENLREMLHARLQDESLRSMVTSVFLGSRIYRSMLCQQGGTSCRLS